MQIEANQTAWTQFKSSITGKDYYKTSDGAVISMAKGTGNVEVTDDNEIKITDAQDVFVKSTKNDDQISILNSEIKRINTGNGTDVLTLDGCSFKKRSMIITSGQGNKGSDTIYINGDCNGAIYAQQGAGSGFGDSGAQKDTIYITGDNYAHISVDSQDKVYVKGEQNGKVVNTTYVPNFN